MNRQKRHPDGGLNDGSKVPQRTHPFGTTPESSLYKTALQDPPQPPHPVWTFFQNYLYTKSKRSSTAESTKAVWTFFRIISIPFKVLRGYVIRRAICQGKTAVMRIGVILHAQCYLEDVQDQLGLAN
jgi:hypothetical protein